MNYKLFLLVALLILMGCGKRQSVVLLPDLDGHVGKVTVTPKTGEIATLDTAFHVADAKGHVTVTNGEEVAKAYGEVLSAQPEPTVRFLLHCKFGSSKLTKKSQSLLDEIIAAFTKRASTDVSVIAHTDTMGDEQYNYKLSLKRAAAVTKILVNMGIPKEVIHTDSHGETNLLIPTPDETSEPRNRRVEVLVR